ncbi:MAG: antitermination regulator, partial [Clostridia bacterium]|nr:antitermination regulator [Clostridia bacterium]
MSLKERVYSVLIVSAAEGFNDALATLLPTSKYSPTNFVSNISAAKRALAERAFDFVIINSPLPDDIGTRFAIDTGSSKETVVLLMVRAELQAEIYDKVAEHGVFVLPKPTSKPTMAIALSWLSSAREKLRKTEKKTLSIEEKMEEIRIVNRAKWLLISELKMDEQGAHRY